MKYIEMEASCKVVLVIVIFLLQFAKTRQNSESTTPSRLHGNDNNVVRIKRVVKQQPELLVLNLWKTKDDKDKILKWFSNGTDVGNIASVSPDGRIKMKISGWFQLSVVLSISAYVDPPRCLNSVGVTRMQILFYRNDETVFYFPCVVNKDQEGPISFPLYPIYFNKTDELFIRVTKPGCIYSQGKTGVLTMIRIS